jgi:hypothetical protein
MKHTIRFCGGNVVVIKGNNIDGSAVHWNPSEPGVVLITIDVHCSGRQTCGLQTECVGYLSERLSKKVYIWWVEGLNSTRTHMCQYG